MNLQQQIDAAIADDRRLRNKYWLFNAKMAGLGLIAALIARRIARR